MLELSLPLVVVPELPVAPELLQGLVPAWALTLELMLEPVVRPLKLALPLTLAAVVGAGPGSR